MEVTDRFRKIATAAALAGLLSYAIVLTITPASLNEIAKQFHAPPSRLGSLFFVMMIGFLATILLAGKYSDKYGKLPAIALGNVIMAIGSCLFAWSRSFEMLYPAMLLMGLGGGLGEGTSMALISDLYGGSRRTSMLNLSQAIFGIGAIAGPIGIASLIKADTAWQTGYIVTVVVCLISTVIAYQAIRISEEKPVSLTSAEGPNWRRIAADPLVIWLSLGILLYVGAEQGQANWLAKYFKDNLHASRTTAPTSVAVFWLGITAGRWVGVWISRFVTEVPLIRGALGLAVISQAALLLAGGSPLGMIATFALGVCMGPIFPTIVSCTCATHPKQSGMIVGFVMTFATLGAAMFPPAIGQLAGSTGLRTALWLCFAASALNVIIFTKLRIRK